jgi:hypothetical protein
MSCSPRRDSTVSVFTSSIHKALLCQHWPVMAKKTVFVVVSDPFGNSALES